LSRSSASCIASTRFASSTVSIMVDQHPHRAHVAARSGLSDQNLDQLNVPGFATSLPPLVYRLARC
jgi:hypothetical protein